MYPLLEIKTVPIEIQVKRTSASLEYIRGTAEMEISRSEQGLDIKSRPIKAQLDSYESRSASGRTAAPMPSFQPSGEAGYEATAAVSDSGALMLNARLENMNQSGQAQTPSLADSEFPMDIGPLSSVQQQPEGVGSMEIRYEMDKLNFDWKMDQGGFQFTPGDIEISWRMEPGRFKYTPPSKEVTVVTPPEVRIRYLGGPIYVPRSADPNYEPVDVRA